jgi:ABC-type Mn2+/Zn2+ transport system ATPase subunit
MELHWPMTGLDAAAMALSAYKPLGWVGGAIGRVREGMKTMGVEDLARRPFAKMSGGQQQRVLLAGALATGPDVLVLDEPTDGLDVRSRQTLLDVLHQQNVTGLCTVMISHEVEDLLYLADEVAWLHAGDDPEQPSYVEMIRPEELVQRVTKVRHAI